MDIMLVDDHPLVVEGLQMILSGTDFNVVCEAANVNDALTKYKTFQPEMALVDIRLGSESGFDFIEAAKRENEDAKFVVFSSDGSKENFDKTQSYAVDGYILKDAFPEEVVYALNLIKKGRKYYDPKVLEAVLSTKGSDHLELKDITPREYDILVELGNGLNNKKIAEKLFISEYTVKKHVSRILFKLDLEDRTQAALFANKHKISTYCD